MTRTTNANWANPTNRKYYNYPDKYTRPPGVPATPDVPFALATPDSPEWGIRLVVTHVVALLLGHLCGLCYLLCL